MPPPPRKKTRHSEAQRVLVPTQSTKSTKTSSVSNAKANTASCGSFTLHVVDLAQNTPGLDDDYGNDLRALMNGLVYITTTSPCLISFLSLFSCFRNCIGQTENRKKSRRAMSKKIEPHENDILMGRGGKNNQHSGNEKLRQIARKGCKQY